MPQDPRETPTTSPEHRAPATPDPHDAPVAPPPAEGQRPEAAEPAVVLDRPPVYAASLPSTPVKLRDGAVVDPSALRLLEEGAVKYNTFASRPGFPSGAANLRTHLHVEAWVRGAGDAPRAWADIHVSTYDGTVVHQETLHFERAPARSTTAPDGGDVFVLDRDLYQGLVATPGSVSPRPDARIVQYRLYGEHEGRLYTDGRVHQCYLKPDAMSA